MKQSKKTFLYFTLIILPVIFILRLKSFFVAVGRDAGAFAYIGDMILKGAVPYRDIWDHKTPLIYYLNAGLFKFFGSSFLTLAFSEVIFLWFGCILFYKLANLLFDRKISLWLCLIFAAYMSTLKIAESFGMTETYAELAIVAALYFSVKYKNQLNIFCLFFSGLMISVAFLFRQTGLAGLLPIVVYLAISKRAGTARKIPRITVEYLILFAGLLTPIFAIYLYFLTHNALKDCLSQMFTYNFVYCKTSLPVYAKILRLIKETYKSDLRIFPFLLSFGITGAVCKSYDFFKHGRRDLRYGLSRDFSVYFMLAALLFLDFYSVSMSNRYYPHYFVQVIPALTLLSGYALEYLFKYSESASKTNIFLIILFIFGSALPSDIYESAAFFRNKGSILDKHGINIKGQRYICRYPALTDWIMKNTSRDDYIYIWGAEPGVYFIAERKCPSKYIYIFPLQTDGYIKNDDLEGFINELALNKPKFIINTNTHTAKTFTLDFQIGDVRLTAERLTDFIAARYTYATTIEGCDIYRKKEKYGRDVQGK